jgi:hypothetical protein
VHLRLRTQPTDSQPANRFSYRHKGLSMVDIRDIGEVAAGELLRREKPVSHLPCETYALVGPDR